MWNKKLFRPLSAFLVLAGLFALFACNPDTNRNTLDFTVTASSPSQGESGVPIALPSIALTFSQAVRQTDAGRITLTQQSSGEAVPLASIESVANGVFLALEQKLSPETAYVLHLEPGAAIALTGSASGEYRLEFTTGGPDGTDVQPPVLLQTYPESNGGDFDPAGELLLLFDEPVMAAAHFQEILLTDASGAQVSITANIVGSRLCIQGQLTAGQVYTLLVPGGALQDYAMNVFEEPIQLAFSTAKQQALDTRASEAPYAVITVPGDGMADVSVGTFISVVYHTQIRQGDAWGGISVTAQDGKNCFTNAKLHKNELQIFAGLQAGQAYTVTVPEGAVKNVAGTAGKAVSFSFTTASNAHTDAPAVTPQPPKPVLTVPAQGDTGVSVSLPEIRIRFDKNIINGPAFSAAVLETDGGRQTEILLGVSGNTVTVKLLEPLQENTGYRLQLPSAAVKDVQGNASQEPFQLAFRTGKGETTAASSTIPTVPPSSTSTENSTTPQTVTIAGEVYPVDIRELTIVDRPLDDMDGLRKLTRLESLTLNNTGLTDITPLAGLTQLKELHLELNQIQDLHALSSLTRLETLSLRFNQITDISPLLGLTGLRDLTLSDNDLSDLSPLRSLTGLNRLSITNNRVSDLTPLAQLTGLTYLAAEFNQIKDLRPLAGLRNLESLYLSKNIITDVSPLSNLSRLRELLLSSNQIGSTQGLEALRQLTALYLSDNPLAQNQIAALKSVLSGCEVVF